MAFRTGSAHTNRECLQPPAADKALLQRRISLPVQFRQVLQLGNIVVIGVEYSSRGLSAVHRRADSA